MPPSEAWKASGPHGYVDGGVALAQMALDSDLMIGIAS